MVAIILDTSEMAEPRRHDDPAGDLNDRDSRIESLLVEGLEHYFASRFEEAIHLWTRVLFLDRSHARARAYIDRARSAIAERQRRAEAMLQESDELLAQGQTAAARHLLAEAIATTGDDERAAALRSKLERLERAHAGSAVAAPHASTSAVAPRWRAINDARFTLTAIGVAAVAVLIIASVPNVQRWLGLSSGDRRLTAAVERSRLPVMSSGEVALVRARSLYNRGRLAEALQALERVSVDSPVRAAADQLRVEIQQILLAGRPAASRPLPPAEAVKR
jgi:tetratricopeptide (TPR) repeat protein